MKLLVSGGRTYHDWVRVSNVLDPYKDKYGQNNLIIIHGAANGADSEARAWAVKNGIHHAAVPALWDYWRNAAGPRRNTAMLLLDPDEAIFFPGGNGTRNMMEQFRNLDKPFKVIISETAD